MKRSLLIGFALLIVLVLSFLTWIFASESGLFWAYRQAQSRLPGALTVDEISGRLGGSVRLVGIEYQDPAQTIKVGQVTLNWDPWSLLKAEIDVSSLQVEALEVSILESPGDSDSTTADATGPIVQLPLSLRARAGAN